MADFLIGPQYLYQCEIFEIKHFRYNTMGSDNMQIDSVANEEKIAILYGSQTGISERYARETRRNLGMRRTKFFTLNDFACEESKSKLKKYEVILVITSTFGWFRTVSF